MKAKTKRFFKRTAIVAISAVLTLCLFGCSQSESAHEHVFSESWSYDETYHWHEPVCNDATPQKERHSFVGGKCSVCDFSKNSPAQSPDQSQDQGQDQGGSESQNPNQGNQGNQGSQSGNEGSSQGSQGGNEGNQGQGNQESQGGEQSQKPSGGETQNPTEPDEPIKPDEGDQGNEGNQGSEQGGNQGEAQQPQVEPNPSLDELYGNCFPTDDSTITGKPNAAGLVKYRIRVNRANGLKICWRESIGNGAYRLHYPKVRVTNEKKVEVYNDIVPVWKGCIYGSGQVCLLDLELPAGNYTVEPLDLPDGFVYQKEYSLTTQRPILDLRLSSKLLKGDEPIKKIAEGMVFPDLTFHSINKGDVTLGALLQKHKIVILSFFYSGCFYCMEECPALVKTYQKYKDLFTFVLIDTVDSREGAMELVKSPRWFGELANEFYIVCDTESDDPLYRKFASSGVPANLFIDQGGYLFEDASGLTEAHFEEILYFNCMANVT